MSRPLGDKQRGLLKSLAAHKRWFHSYKCGWVWDTPSGTAKILESLVARGLVKKHEEDKHTVYTLTEEGVNESKK